MAKAVRLDKFLADAGKGTRSEVKKFIQKGQVQVNGVPAKKPEMKVDPENDVVVLSGETVGVAPEFVYYLLNKPAGCVSATEDVWIRIQKDCFLLQMTGCWHMSFLHRENMWTKHILSAWRESLRWKIFVISKMVWISAKKN